MEKYGIIYKVRNKVNNKVYIGQTTHEEGFDGRYNNNLEKYTHNQHLKRSINKYGIDNFEIDKEFDVAYSKEELDKLEIMYIDKYNCCNPNFGYNDKLGGESGKHTERVKLKISHIAKAQKRWVGENNPRYKKGYEVTGALNPAKRIDVRNKISKKMKKRYKGHIITCTCECCGKKFTKTKSQVERSKHDYCSDECRSKGMTLFYSGENNPLYNRKTIKCDCCGKEIKKAPSDITKYNYCSRDCQNKHYKKRFKDKNNPNYGNTGKVSGSNNGRARKVVCITTNEVFECMKDGADKYKTKNNYIGQCCKGKQKSAGKHPETGEKLVWQYYEDYIEQKQASI